MPVCKHCGQELPKTYKIGQKFKHRQDIYILSLTDTDDVCLISLIDGNRWKKPIKIDVDNWSISKSDFYKDIVGSEFSVLDFVPIEVDINIKE
jgi:hypothetical protein